MDPEVKIIENFMSQEDCNYFIDIYKDKLKRSTVLSNVNNDLKGFISDVRTSHTYSIPLTDHIIGTIQTKIAELLQIDIRNMEHPQMTRYLKGEFFKQHHDCLPKESNQREYTVIVYLNDLEEQDGGKTEFPMCGISITPKTGRLMWFKNCYPNGHRITRAAHIGGEILTDTVKYIITFWVRQGPIIKKD